MTFPEQDPMIGLAIGRYIVRSKLAEGGMGAVYVASHELLPTKKVVKILLGEFSRNEVIRQRFEREAKAASRLKHSHIITIDDFGTLPDGQLFLMMPFLDGKPLDVHIQQHGRLSQHHTLQIMVQVCSALQHLHEHGIVHRDLKPGNIFLVQTEDNAYHVTLIDLGIARDAADSRSDLKTHTGMAMGTPGYMAPEQYENAAAATHSADIYAAGIITWEMLTGVMPWGFQNTQMYLHKQLTEIPQPPAGHDLSPEILDLLHRTLSKFPSGRPPTARAFATAFASITAAVPPHVPSGSAILERYAPELTINVPFSEQTIRAGNRNHVAGGFWPNRSTDVSSIPQEIPLTAPPRTASLATANERPQVPAPTTLSAASGAALIAAPSSRSSGRKVMAILVACAVAVGLGTFAFILSRTSVRASSTRSDASHETIAPTTAPASGVFDAMPDAAEVASDLEPKPDAGVVVVDSPIVPTKETSASSSRKRDDKAPRQRVSAPKTGTLDSKNAVTPSGNDLTPGGSNQKPGVLKKAGSGGFDPDAVEE